MTTLSTSLGPGLTEDQAREIFAQGEEAVVFALLALAAMAGQAQAAAKPAEQADTPAEGDESLSTPSGMKPVYKKPTTSSRGKKKPGRPPGHPGSRRPAPKRNTVQLLITTVC